MKASIPYALFLPTQVVHMIADRDPATKQLSDEAKGQMTMERRKEIVRQDMERSQKRTK